MIVCACAESNCAVREALERTFDFDAPAVDGLKDDRFFFDEVTVFPVHTQRPVGLYTSVAVEPKPDFIYRRPWCDAILGLNARFFCKVA
jgi:hypothetical protein